MHQRVVIRALGVLVVVASVGLLGCGGESPQRTDPTWQASDRLPQLAQHWWWQPVERYCEEDRDCQAGETCQTMRLGTCPQCPRGQVAEICVGPNSGGENRQGRQASRKRR